MLQSVARVCTDRGLPERALAEADLLGDDLGLDSLDMATIVAELEQALGTDPFALATPSFRTVGDLIALYERQRP